MEIKITVMYPEILNHYGDTGNVMTLKRRLTERGFGVNIYNCPSEGKPCLKDTDILYIGGGTDKSRTACLGMLREIKDEILTYAHEGGVILAVCSGYEMLSKAIETDEGIIEGLGIFDTEIKAGSSRLAGNIITENKELGFDIVGFENHTGVCKSNNSPLGKVLYGYGNGPDKSFEGAIYKNAIGTYIHGPVLPKNPAFADYIIRCAVKKHGITELCPIDDELELKARNYIKEKTNNISR